MIITLLGLSAWASTAHHLHLLPAAIAGLAATLMSSVIFQRETQTPSPVEETGLHHPQSRRSDRQLTRVLIVGAGAVGRQVAESLEAGGRHEVVGFVDDHIDWIDHDRWMVLGRRQATAAVVQEHDIDEVVVAYAPTWQQQLAEQLSAECPDVGLRVVPSPYEALMRVHHVESYGDIALVSLNTGVGRPTEVIKRGFDIGVSIFTLVLFSPLWVLIAHLVKLTSRGPIIFAQERVGRYGKPFMVYKFRTMRQDAEAATGPVLSTGKEDDRLTPIGRYLRLFRIDEVPQLWNVLRGEMSLVGPRPERPVFVEQFECMLPSYAKRHQVRPGITGLAQVCGGYHTDMRDKLRFDLIYVSHQSLVLDLWILIRTISVVVFPNRH